MPAFSSDTRCEGTLACILNDSKCLAFPLEQKTTSNTQDVPPGVPAAAGDPCAAACSEARALHIHISTTECSIFKSSLSRPCLQLACREALCSSLFCGKRVTRARAVRDRRAQARQLPTLAAHAALQILHLMSNVLQPARRPSPETQTVTTPIQSMLACNGGLATQGHQ